ncbi:hypothetical protein HOY82DRAFT_571234, partial [Tuber indicum]
MIHSPPFPSPLFLYQRGILMIPHGAFHTFIETVTLCVPMALITLCSIFFHFWPYSCIITLCYGWDSYLLIPSCFFFCVAL